MSEQMRRHEADDVEGHGFRLPADAERDEADDVQGHGFRPAGIDTFADGDGDDEDDVAGHGLGPIDPKRA